MGDQAFGCGQCLPCRINKRRVWAHRIMLEALLHEQNTFVTLTYNDENLPEDGSVNPEHTKAFLKRLREHISRKYDRKTRFFLVGEYGDESERPHYHLALFNYPNCEYGRSRYSLRRTDCCPNCDLVRDVWNKGHVVLGTLTMNSARYVANYTTKKMTSVDDERLNGRHPEFARMSRNPGIAADAVVDMVESIKPYLDGKDVPMYLVQGNKRMPLGNYLVKKLRAAIGRDEKTPKEILDQKKAELRVMREDIRDASEDGKASDDQVRMRLITETDGQVNRVEKLERFYKRTKQL